MPKPPLDGVILITGASSGIGAELARELAPRAKALVLLARRVERLEALASELRKAHPALTVSVKGCDLLDQAQSERVMTAIEAELGQVDVLINNAGFGDVSMFDLSSWEKNQRMIELNVTALTFLTHRLLPGMVSRRRGGVLQVSSGFGLSFMPGFAAYVGTKHYVTGFTESLRLDVASQGVAVSQLCPGPVRTEFEDHAADFAAPEIPSWISMSAERCARISVRGFSSGRAIIVPGALMKFATVMSGFTPRAVLRLCYGPVASKMRKLQQAALSAEPAPEPSAKPNEISKLN